MEYDLIPFDEIEVVDFDETQYLKTGIKQLDKMICGFGLGQLVVLTGPRAGGKTTLIGNVICNFIEQGHYGFLFSFEMANPRLRRWLTLQALGKDNLKERRTQTGRTISYPASKEKEQAAASWIGKRLRVFNNAGFNKNEIMNLIKRYIKEIPQTKFIVLDNLMKIDFSGDGDQKYSRQSEFVKELQAFAQANNICVILVAHPNKVKTIPRIEDVGGSGDIINTADTVVFVHRVTTDFKKRAIDELKWEVTAPEFKADNLIEVVKDREFGDDNSFIAVYFEPKAKRFLNKCDENAVYGFDIRTYQPKMRPTLTEITDDDGEIPF